MNVSIYWAWSGSGQHPPSELSLHTRCTRRERGTSYSLVDFLPWHRAIHLRKWYWCSCSLQRCFCSVAGLLESTAMRQAVATATCLLRLHLGQAATPLEHGHPPRLLLLAKSLMLRRGNRCAEAIFWYSHGLVPDEASCCALQSLPHRTPPVKAFTAHGAD